MLIEKKFKQFERFIGHRFLRFSLLLGAGVIVAGPVVAQLKIDPYPSQQAAQPSAQSQSKTTTAAPYSSSVRRVQTPLDYAPPPPKRSYSSMDASMDVEAYDKDVYPTGAPLRASTKPGSGGAYTRKIMESLDETRLDFSSMSPLSSSDVNVTPVEAVSVAPAAVVQAPAVPQPVVLSQAAQDISYRLENMNLQAPQSGRYVVDGAPNAPIKLYAPVPVRVADIPDFTDDVYTYEPREPAPSAPVMPQNSYDPASVIQAPRIIASSMPMAVKTHSNLLRSQAGGLLSDTLSAWSNQAGVTFIWAAPEVDFEILGDLALQTSYEAGVQLLLEQYETYSMRPVAQLHVDPQSGARTLVVQILDAR